MIIELINSNKCILHCVNFSKIAIFLRTKLFYTKSTCFIMKPYNNYNGTTALCLIHVNINCWLWISFFLSFFLWELKLTYLISLLHNLPYVSYFSHSSFFYFPKLSSQIQLHDGWTYTSELLDLHFIII